jgi:hypothetical protein
MYQTNRLIDFVTTRFTKHPSAAHKANILTWDILITLDDGASGVFDYAFGPLDIVAWVFSILTGKCSVLLRNIQIIQLLRFWLQSYSAERHVSVLRGPNFR